MRKQLDTRWKQVDKFESSVKAYGEAKATWRRKYVTKEGELETFKVMICLSLYGLSFLTMMSTGYEQ